MQVRVLLAVPEQELVGLLRSLLDAALALVPLDVAVAEARCRHDLVQRVRAGLDDVVLLDWDLAGPDTPALVRDLAGLNPRVRLVALLPLELRQYRQRVWEAGASSSIPKGRLDQEWLSSLLCVMSRDMSKEARLTEFSLPLAAGFALGR